jgi:hypothetical protein
MTDKARVKTKTPSFYRGGLNMQDLCRCLTLLAREKCLTPRERLNFKMREGAVGFGHLMGIFFFLDDRTFVLIRRKDLVS